MAAPNFSDLEAAFEECGSSYEEYQQAVREEYRITCTIEKLYDAVYEEFRHGNDRIGDTVCGDVAEYWSCYLAGIVYPATEDWKETTLVPMLEEAEEFCDSMVLQEQPFYALNSEAQQQGFSSYDIGESIQNRLTYMEEQSDALERDIQENASLTQADLNVKSQELYDMWDSMLNEVWETLKQTQDAETMEKLNVQEREWIAWKERQIREAGEEFEGGSLQPMVCAQKAAELTRERVYELIAVLDPE